METKIWKRSLILRPTQLQKNYLLHTQILTMRINKLLRRLVLCYALLTSSNFLSAQVGLDLLDTTETTSFYIGGISPNVLTQGNVEVNFYTSLFSNWLAQQAAIIESPVVDRWRFTEFSANVEAYTGVTKNGRWDIGLRLKYARTRLDNSARSSPFKVFHTGNDEVDGRLSVGNNEEVDRNYSGFKEIGLRFRVVPFTKVPALTINGGFSFSPIRDVTDAWNLQADRNSLDLNLAYHVSLNNNAYYYFIGNWTGLSPSSIKADTNDDGFIDRAIDDKWRYNTGFSFFVVQLFANRKIAVYPGLSYNIGYKKPDQGDQSLIKLNEQVLGVLGVQYQPSNNISWNISTALPLVLKTTNRLFKPVAESYSFVSIGGRFLF